MDENKLNGNQNHQVTEDNKNLKKSPSHMGGNDGVDSDTGPSYAPSIGQMMEENFDMYPPSGSEKNTSSMDEQEELRHLIEESQIPLDALITKYNKECSNWCLNDLEKHEDFERKRRSSMRNYNEDLDNDDFIYSLNPKQVQIGDSYQIPIPDNCTKEDVAPSSNFDDVIWDPYQEFPMSLTDFFIELKRRRPRIFFEDELIMALFRKHGGNIESSLCDGAFLEHIESIHNGPLIDWTMEECLSFKDAILKYGKRFDVIQINCYPGKSVKNIVNAYYVWKKSPLYMSYLNELNDIQSKAKIMNLDSEYPNGSVDEDRPASWFRENSDPSVNNFDNHNNGTAKDMQMEPNA